MRRILTAAALSCSLVALLIPTMALAARHDTTGKPRVVFGTICSYSAGSNVVIGQSCGGPGTTTVALRAHTFYDYEGMTSPVPAPANGDAVAAFVWYNKLGAPQAWKLEYSESVFAYARGLFPGTYVSSTGDCTSGSLSIQGLGSKGTEHTFITDGTTVYENSGDASTCAIVTGGYVTNQPIVVWGLAMTTGVWDAARINANPSGSHRNPFSDEHVIFGTICAYTPGVSAVISQNCGSTSDVLVNLDQHTWFVYRGTTTPAPAPVVGDSAAAYLRWRNNFATVGEFAYSEDPFNFARGLFAGTYVSSSGDCTVGGLTIKNLGDNAQVTFSTDVNTIYLNRGVASTCAFVTGGYKVGEPFIILGNEFTNATWYAVRINAHPAIAHRHPRRSLHLVFGIICAYTAGKSVTISQSCGGPGDVTINLTKHTTLVYEGVTTPTPAPVVGDSVAAFFRWPRGVPTAWKLEYSENTFAFAKSRFLGSYSSSAGTCSSGTLTIQTFGRGSAPATFSADAYTVYLNANKASTCAAVSGAYASGESLRVDANALTDNTWYATKIDANPVHK